MTRHRTKGYLWKRNYHHIENKRDMLRRMENNSRKIPGSQTEYVIPVEWKKIRRKVMGGVILFDSNNQYNRSDRKRAAAMLNQLAECDVIVSDAMKTKLTKIIKSRRKPERLLLWYFHSHIYTDNK